MHRSNAKKRKLLDIHSGQKDLFCSFGAVDAASLTGRFAVEVSIFVNEAHCV